MWFARTLLALALLCAPVSSLCLPTYNPEFNFLCNNEMFSEANDNGKPSNSLLDRVNLLYKSAHALSSEDPRERRTVPASKYRYLSQTQLRSKLYRNSAKSDRRNQVTLSLDVPTNIMNILFNIAKAKNLRAKADDNARLLAQIGKRK
ncbi:urocortin 3, like [Pimephales promelas]|uniref:urocortin 3, like n=1 Tax=Pimephales promelas TaxID=90988 RepID=UPI001955C5F7|nr:urocortin 3, like [Pimephales promelas]KAG1953012.1 urocortin-3 preproprotein [Pimephales promelas]